MEPVVEWMPSDCRESGTMEPPAVEMFRSCQSSFSSFSSEHMVIECGAATQHNYPAEISDNPIRMLRHVADEDNMRMMKIHRFPANIRDPNQRYRVPTVVAIGPYHHGRDQLKHAEKMKRVAVHQCKEDSGGAVQEIYDAVVPVADAARRLYDDTGLSELEGMSDCDFRTMMFFDACFLVQYISYMTCDRPDMDETLTSFFGSNNENIYYDIMLLENQLPWSVVRAVMGFISVPLGRLIAYMRPCLKYGSVPDEPFALDESHQPAHLLGLLRSYITGPSEKKLEIPYRRPRLFPVSPHDLAEMGISLKANTEIDLTGIGIKKGPFFAELQMPPLQLDARPSWLINLAALEMCTCSNFKHVPDEDAAACSYLKLLTMLVHRESDVYDLRRKGLLQGGGGFTDKDALDFFSSLQGLRFGPGYVRTMAEIEDYMYKRWIWIKIYGFFYRNIKIITTFFSAIIALIGVLKTLQSLKIV